MTNGKHLKAVSDNIPTVFTPFNKKQNDFTDGITIAFFDWSHDVDRFFEVFHNLSKKGNIMQSQNRIPESTMQAPLVSHLKSESKLNNVSNGKMLPSYKEMKVSDLLDMTAISNLAYRQLKVSVRYIEETIRKYPLASVSVAAAIGLIGARFLQSSK